MNQTKLHVMILVKMTMNPAARAQLLQRLGAHVSQNELADVERCLSNPTGPSQTILSGEALLQKLRRRSR